MFFGEIYFDLDNIRRDIYGLTLGKLTKAPVKIFAFHINVFPIYKYIMSKAVGLKMMAPL